MKIAVYGGSFNPPHKGHLHAARCAAEKLKPDLFLVIPGFQPPHKILAVGSPTPVQRLELCRLNFSDIPNLQCSDIEINRGGTSYTADTLRQLKERYPDAELFLLLGTDIFLGITDWYDAAYILKNVTLIPFCRTADDADTIRAHAETLAMQYDAKVDVLFTEPVEAASTDIRAALHERGGAELMTDEVYSYIVRNRLYDVRVNFEWLREKAYAMLKPKRIPHVRGCEEEAVQLALRWGGDAEAAAEAAILHDCTKKVPLEGQLALCSQYGIVPDELEQISEKLLHAKTGAAIAQHVFGCSDDIVNAIRWHTTGRSNMTLLEKILYMADYIEPNRKFEGVEQLRVQAYDDLDQAMLLGFVMSLDDIRQQGNQAHHHTLEALAWYRDITLLR